VRCLLFFSVSSPYCLFLILLRIWPQLVIPGLRILGILTVVVLVVGGLAFLLWYYDRSLGILRAVGASVVMIFCALGTIAVAWGFMQKLVRSIRHELLVRRYRRDPSSLPLVKRYEAEEIIEADEKGERYGGVYFLAAVCLFLALFAGLFTWVMVTSWLERHGYALRF